MYLVHGAIISGDASHNCYPDCGKIGLRVEEECTKEIWNLIKEKLERLNFKVIDCTPWNKEFYSVGESLLYRVRIANESSAVLHLCIDLNDSEVKGVECWVNSLSLRATKFAEKICNNVEKLGYHNKGVKFGEIYITEYTIMPCILIKCCCLNSLDDMERYNAIEIAEAIVNAITNLGTK